MGIKIIGAILLLTSLALIYMGMIPAVMAPFFHTPPPPPPAQSQSDNQWDLFGANARYQQSVYQDAVKRSRYMAYERAQEISMKVFIGGLVLLLIGLYMLLRKSTGGPSEMRYPEYPPE